MQRWTLSSAHRSPHLSVVRSFLGPTCIVPFGWLVRFFKVPPHPLNLLLENTLHFRPLICDQDVQRRVRTKPGLVEAFKVLSASGFAFDEVWTMTASLTP